MSWVLQVPAIDQWIGHYKIICRRCLTFIISTTTTSLTTDQRCRVLVIPERWWTLVAASWLPQPTDLVLPVPSTPARLLRHHPSPPGGRCSPAGPTIRPRPRRRCSLTGRRRPFHPTPPAVGLLYLRTAPRFPTSPRLVRRPRSGPICRRSTPEQAPATTVAVPVTRTLPRTLIRTTSRPSTEDSNKAPFNIMSIRPAQQQLLQLFTAPDYSSPIFRRQLLRLVLCRLPRRWPTRGTTPSIHCATWTTLSRAPLHTTQVIYLYCFSGVVFSLYKMCNRFHYDKNGNRTIKR